MNESDEHNQIQHLAEYIADNKASVVVGAGFSLNAIPKDSRVPHIFPLWGDIATEMYSCVCRKLDDSYEGDQKGYDSEERELTYLEIASLFESLFDRDELDKLIRSIIPDDEYIPGEAHTRLLSLPWKNVFTTNFDTLLERANDDDLGKRYHLVEKENDFYLSGKPKIIKLHGSFSSDKHFIITQKDYETYVEQNKVFANKMQSVLTENAFCLIGFSGKDPNFDDRTWWARFHLRDHCPPTYLVCLERVSKIKKEFYKSRGITTIELNDEVEEAERREEKNAKQNTILTFLKQLNDLVNTINFSKSEDAYDYHDLIPIYQSQVFHPKGKMFPEHGSLEAIDLQKQYEIWQAEREEYPGWIVAPNRYRSGLWAHTERWIEPILVNIEKVTPNLALFLLFELNWRFETTFCPLLPEWVRIIDRIIQQFDTESNQHDSSFPSVILESPTINEETEKISDCLYSLHLSIARTARVNQDIKRYSNEIEYLQQNHRNYPIRIQQLGYEKAIGALFVFDENRLRECLQPENWPKEFRKNPIFALRRAAILAELGDTDEAEVTVSETISILQTENNKTPPDQNISGYSQEAWGQILLKALKLNWPPVALDQDEEKRNALLELFGLNPTAECSQLEYLLKSDPREIPIKESKTIEYDPGHFSVRGDSFSFSSNLEVSDLIPSYTMLKIFESAGMPYHCGMFSLFREGVVNASNYISQNSWYLSVLSLLRTGDRDEILSRFSRMDIAILPGECVERLFSILETSIPQALDNLNKNEARISLFTTLFSQRLIGIFPEILSRLSFRLTPDQLSRAYSLSINLYKEPIIQKFYFLNESVKNMLPRVLFAMEPYSVLQKLPELLSLPILGYECPVPSIPEKWIDPFQDEEWLKEIPMEAEFERETLDRSIDHLLKVGVSEVPEARQRALIRLLRLYENQFLTETQAKEYGRVLWSQTDENHIPVNTGLNIHALLDLPKPDLENFNRFIKESLLTANYRRYIVSGVDANGNKNQKFQGVSADPLPWNIITVSNSIIKHPTLYPKNRIDWTDEEILKLFHKIQDYWGSLKTDLGREKVNSVPFCRGQIEDQLDGIVRVLGDLIIPALLRMKQIDLARRCEVILREIGDYDIQISPALYSLIQLNPSIAQEAENYIYNGLVSENENEVSKAHLGIYNWLLMSLIPEEAIPLPPQHLWDLISFELLLLRQPGLDNTIHLFCERLDRRMGKFSDLQLTMMVASLEKLKKELDSIGKRTNLNIPQSVGISRIEVPYYRLLCAQFGCALYQYLNEEHLEIPLVIEKMKQEGMMDTLPEIRKIWKRNREHSCAMVAP